MVEEFVTPLYHEPAYPCFGTGDSSAVRGEWQTGTMAPQRARAAAAVDGRGGASTRTGGAAAAAARRRPDRIRV